MPRVLLHQRLLARATELGVGFHWKTVVKGIEEVGQVKASNSIPSSSGVTVHTSRGPLRARFLVGADGNQSRVRGWAGLDRSSISARRIGLRQHFALEPWTGFVEVYWSDHGQAYVTPVSPHEVCVAFIARQKFPSVAAALACFPQLQSRLGSALPSDVPRGSITRIVFDFRFVLFIFGLHWRTAGFLGFLPGIWLYRFPWIFSMEKNSQCE